MNETLNPTPETTAENRQTGGSSDAGADSPAPHRQSLAASVENISQAERTHYKVPRENHRYLIQPDFPEAVQQIESNRQRLNQAAQLLWGRSLQEWRAAGRQQCLARAICFTSQLDQSACQQVDAAVPLVATGHQPELFHPGVWAKNILAAQLARKVQGVSLNLVVDSDTVKSRAVAVPAVVENQLVIRRVTIDEWQTGVPWQEQKVHNRALFEKFAERVCQQLAPLHGSPVLPKYWQAVLQAWNLSGNLVQAFVCGRRNLEQELGVHNFEITLSQVCQTPVFQEFMAGLLLDAEQFRLSYNRALNSYRELYRLKSESHPMPDLLLEEGWLELPFWVWTEKNKQRRSLFLQRQGDQLELTDRAGFTTTLALPQEETAQRQQLAKQLQELMQTGVRLRPRALITTLFMRLFVTDWFIHGIGGAKYDEITDTLIQDYWGLTPPGFQVATGTLWLPLEDLPEVPPQTPKILRQQLRYATENPESLREQGSGNKPENSAGLQELLARKEQLMLQQNQRPAGLTRKQRLARRSENRKRHQEFQAIRSQLAEQMQQPLQQLRQELDKAIRNEKLWKIAAYREFPFCCYPEETLQDLVKDLQRRGG